MACYKPLRAWRTDDNQIVFAERGRIHSEITLACGQCTGCRLERSRQWAIRCMHEAQMHKYNSFITLTYDDEHLPDRYWEGKYKNNGTKAYAGNLQYRDIQLFLKKIRNKITRDSEHQSKHAWQNKQEWQPQLSSHSTNTVLQSTHKQVRFYMAGEYGEQYSRPHYHMCLFGTDFPNKIYIGKTPSGSKLYRSEQLEKLWPQGFSSIGQITFESAAYVARYIMKKITGKQQQKHYEKTDQETGEIIRLKPEFNSMSRAQGIGLAWLTKYTSDVYPHSYVIVRGKKSNPPRYYDKQYQKTNPTEWEAIEYDRFTEGKKHYQDQTAERLQARQTVAEATISLLKRKL